jgi:hypothetical protein
MRGQYCFLDPVQDLLDEFVRSTPALCSGDEMGR